MTTSNQYGEDSYCKNIPLINTATNEISFADQIKIVPNPTTDIISVFNPTSFNVDKIRIFDPSGKFISDFDPRPNISIGHLSTGLYFLEIHTSSGRRFKKKY